MICNNCMTEITKTKDIVKCIKCGTSLHKDCANHCLKCNAILCDMCSIDNHFKCDSCQDEKPGKIDFIRRSHIELYKACPYAFYLEVVKKLPTKGGIYAENGTVLHDLFDIYSNHKDDTDHNLQWLIDNYNNEFTKLIEHEDIIKQPELKDRIYEIGMSSINNYHLMEEELPKPIDTEKQLFFVLDEELPKIRVTIDRINPHPEGISVLDYKTGKVYTGKKLADDLQISTYIICAEKEYKQPVQSFEFLFVGEGKRRLYTRESDNEFLCRVNKKEYVVNLQEHIREIKILFGRIMQNKFSIPYDVHEYRCNNMCYFGKAGMCAGAEKERWRTGNA